MLSLPPPIARFAAEVSRFGLVGAMGFVVDMAIFNALLAPPLSQGATLAKIISGVLSMLVTWLGNRFWTYRDRNNRPVRQEAALFFIINLVALGATVAWVAAMELLFHISSPFWINVHALIGIAIGTVIRFLAYRQVVFPKDGPN